MNRIRISNERLWEIAVQGENIDEWLKITVGHGNYREWIGIVNLPYRSFSFNSELHETLFILRWL